MYRRIPRIGRTPSLGDRQCDCAERTGELVVMTCPVCCTEALRAMRVLTSRGRAIILDTKGSVSGLLELEQDLYGEHKNSPKVRPSS